jgi:hypothetical protein
MAKEMVGAKVSPKTAERLEKYADREQISKSEAIGRLLKQGLDVEESDMRLVPVKSDGGTVIEENLSQIDGQLQELDQEIGMVSEEIEAVQNQNERVEQIMGGLSLGVIGYLIWAFGVLIFDIPLSLSLLTGGLLLTYLTYYILAFGGYIE